MSTTRQSETREPELCNESPPQPSPTPPACAKTGIQTRATNSRPCIGFHIHDNGTTGAGPPREIRKAELVQCRVGDARYLSADTLKPPDDAVLQDEPAKPQCVVINESPCGTGKSQAIIAYVENGIETAQRPAFIAVISPRITLEKNFQHRFNAAMESLAKRHDAAAVQATDKASAKRNEEIAETARSMAFVSHLDCEANAFTRQTPCVMSSFQSLGRLGKSEFFKEYVINRDRRQRPGLIIIDEPEALFRAATDNKTTRGKQLECFSTLRSLCDCGSHVIMADGHPGTRTATFSLVLTRGDTRRVFRYRNVASHAPRRRMVGYPSVFAFLDHMLRQYQASDTARSLKLYIAASTKAMAYLAAIYFSLHSLRVYVYTADTPDEEKHSIAETLQGSVPPTKRQKQFCGVSSSAPTASTSTSASTGTANSTTSVGGFFDEGEDDVAADVARLVEYDCVVASPTVGVGVNIELPDLFLSVGGVFDGNGCDADMFMQMVQRVRRPAIADVPVCCRSHEAIFAAELAQRRGKQVHPPDPDATDPLEVTVQDVMDQIEAIHKRRAAASEARTAPTASTHSSLLEASATPSAKSTSSTSPLPSTTAGGRSASSTSSAAGTDDAREIFQKWGSESDDVCSAMLFTALDRAIKKKERRHVREAFFRAAEGHRFTPVLHDEDDVSVLTTDPKRAKAIQRMLRLVSKLPYRVALPRGGKAGDQRAQKFKKLAFVRGLHRVLADPLFRKYVETENHPVSLETQLEFLCQVAVHDYFYSTGVDLYDILKDPGSLGNDDVPLSDPEFSDARFAVVTTIKNILGLAAHAPTPRGRMKERQAALFCTLTKSKEAKFKHLFERIDPKLFRKACRDLPSLKGCKAITRALSNARTGFAHTKTALAIFLSYTGNRVQLADGIREDPRKKQVVVDVKFVNTLPEPDIIDKANALFEAARRQERLLRRQMSERDREDGSVSGAETDDDDAEEMDSLGDGKEDPSATPERLLYRRMMSRLAHQQLLKPMPDGLTPEQQAVWTRTRTRLAVISGNLGPPRQPTDDVDDLQPPALVINGRFLYEGVGGSAQELDKLVDDEIAGGLIMHRIINKTYGMTIEAIETMYAASGLHGIETRFSLMDAVTKPDLLLQHVKDDKLDDLTAENAALRAKLRMHKELLENVRTEHTPLGFWPTVVGQRVPIPLSSTSSTMPDSTVQESSGQIAQQQQPPTQRFAFTASVKAKIHDHLSRHPPAKGTRVDYDELSRVAGVPPEDRVRLRAYVTHFRNRGTKHNSM
jgi:hypothetical protein